MTSATPTFDNALNQPARGEYMAQLDGLRAVAALAVIVPHVAPQYGFNLPLGSMAVKLFFVLSGFLITRILLKCRDAADSGKSVAQIAKQFYIRRSLRIFPIYYLTIIVCSLLAIPYFRDLIFWHLTYFTNFYLAFIKRNGEIGKASHLWTLAVEEQFYLIWPWVILLLPRKLLTPAAIAGILVGLFWRLGCKLIHFESAIEKPLPACMDSLCAGALLAMAWRMDGDKWRRTFNRIAIWVGLPLLVAVVIACVTQRYLGIRWVIGDWIFALAFVWIIDRAARERTGVIVGSVLSNPAMVYMGRISYGIYLFHNILMLPIKSGFNKLGYSEPAGWILLPTNIIVTVIFASASWFLIEKPINGLKRYFEYENRETKIEKI